MVNFNVSGSRRKQLVKKLESLLGERAVYMAWMIRRVMDS